MSFAVCISIQSALTKSISFTPDCTFASTASANFFLSAGLAICHALSAISKVCFDDAILSGSTTIEVSKLLKQQGAKQVHFFATHGVFTGTALKDLQQSGVNSVVVTNSIAQAKLPSKIKMLDISPILVENI